MTAKIRGILVGLCALVMAAGLVADAAAGQHLAQGVAGVEIGVCHALPELLPRVGVADDAADLQEGVLLPGRVLLLRLDRQVGAAGQGGAGLVLDDEIRRHRIHHHPRRHAHRRHVGRHVPDDARARSHHGPLAHHDAIDDCGARADIAARAEAGVARNPKE